MCRLYELHYRQRSPPNTVVQVGISQLEPPRFRSDPQSRCRADRCVIRFDVSVDSLELIVVGKSGDVSVVIDDETKRVLRSANVLDRRMRRAKVSQQLPPTTTRNGSIERIEHTP